MTCRVEAGNNNHLVERFARLLLYDAGRPAERDQRLRLPGGRQLQHRAHHVRQNSGAHIQQVPSPSPDAATIRFSTATAVL